MQSEKMFKRFFFSVAEGNLKRGSRVVIAPRNTGGKKKKKKIWEKEKKAFDVAFFFQG